MVLPYIGHLNPKVSLTPDYPYHQIGHFRCFTGHTNALAAYMTDDSCLVFEDDCVPDNQYDWNAAIAAGNKMVLEQGFDMACLHGRGFDYNLFERRSEYGHSWLLPLPNTHRWVLGTLCYVISKSAAKRFYDTDYWAGGCNIDLFMWSERFNFCVLDPTPFIHDRSQGSILENSKNTEYVIR